MSEELLAKISTSIIEGEPDETVALTEQALAAGLEPMKIVDEGLVPGMNVVGDKFQCGEYFLPHLIIAANGMQQALKVLEPELNAREQAVETKGTLVIGSVAGDIHEIGKSLVGVMLSAQGFEVHDLGTDVESGEFVARAREHNADIVGLSALLTTTMLNQQEVIELLVEAGLRERVKVMVGGSPVTQAWADEIGADGFAEDAATAARVARKLMGR